jgi:hypothetical protein
VNAVILLLALVTPTGEVSTQQVKFNNVDACLVAAATQVEMMKQIRSNDTLYTFCIDYSE